MNRRSNLVVVGSMLLVFLAGAVVGGFADHLFFPRQPKARLTQEQFKNKLIADLNKRLNLQPDQLDKLKAIFDATGVRFHEIHNKIEPDLTALRSEHDDKVRAILNPPQRTEYDKWRAERERQRAEDQRK